MSPDVKSKVYSTTEAQMSMETVVILLSSSQKLKKKSH